MIIYEVFMWHNFKLYDITEVISTEEEHYTKKPNVVCLFSSNKETGGANQLMEFIVQREDEIDIYQATYEDYVPDEDDLPPPAADEQNEEQKENDVNEGGALDNNEGDTGSQDGEQKGPKGD